MFKYSPINDPEYESKLEEAKNDRINELNSIYEPWEMHYWKFPEDIQRSNAIPLTVIDIMRNAYNSYILGLFDSTILLSSIAVETTIHFILKLHKVQNCKKITNNNIKPYCVNTIYGIKKFGFYKNRFGEFIKKDNDQNEYFSELESLNKIIDKCKNLGYDTSAFDKSVKAGHRLFVVRRDTLAHGNFEGLALTQEIIDMEDGKYKNQEEQIRKLYYIFNIHKPQAFDQYKAASEFIISVFKKFDSEYGLLTITK